MPPAPASPIQIEHLSLAHPDSEGNPIPALRDASLSVAAGEIVDFWFCAGHITWIDPFSARFLTLRKSCPH
jgi:hypothetical protein